VPDVNFSSSSSSSCSFSIFKPPLEYEYEDDHEHEDEGRLQDERGKRSMASTRQRISGLKVLLRRLPLECAMKTETGARSEFLKAGLTI
jgi:hypothetical protein